jgi:hypothetical protein
MKTQTEQQPRTGEIVMICGHVRTISAVSSGAHLVMIPGGPKVFSNLDDRFFSAWLYFCDDCFTKASVDAHELSGLIRGPMEWSCDGERVGGAGG